MPSALIVEFRNVWKKIQHQSGRMLLRSHLKNVLTPREENNAFYALKGVSFHMERGESLAVIGANGAGKSTLLNIVAGLVPPDRGTVGVRGRIAALLELGSGFHPDLHGL